MSVDGDFAILSRYNPLDVFFSGGAEPGNERGLMTAAPADGYSR